CDSSRACCCRRGRDSGEDDAGIARQAAPSRGHRRNAPHRRGNGVLTLDAIQTLAAGGLCLAAGYAIRRRVPLLGRFNIPAPVIGGLLVALAILACRWQGYQPVRFDTALKEPL